MKIKKKFNGRIYSATCTGSVLKRETNKPLANMLKYIQENGIEGFCHNDKYKGFADGLCASFKRDKYLRGDGKLSKTGEEIVKTEKADENLYGGFELKIVEVGGKKYVYDLLTNAKKYDGSTNDLNIEKTRSFNNSDGMEIRSLELDRYCVCYDDMPIELEGEYDYVSENSVYSLIVNNKKYQFTVEKNAQNDFNLINGDSHRDALERIFSEYDLSFYDRTVEMRNNCLENNRLQREAIETIFVNKSFSIPANDYDKIEIEDISINISDEECSEAVLIKYLLSKAEKSYCGLNEIVNLKAEFFSLFKAEYIGNDNNKLFDKMIEKAFETGNMTAYLRLNAYRDLVPAEIRVPKKNDVIEFSRKKESIASIADKIFSSNGKLKSLCMLTKFAYKNATIARAVYLLGKHINDKHGVPLTVITCVDNGYGQSPVAKKWYDKLKQEEKYIRFIEVDQSKIKKIHDRYYKVKYDSSDEVWWKVGGELDKIYYDGDFADGKNDKEGISEHTKGTVTEMTFTRTEYKHIIDDVRKIMEV